MQVKENLIPPPSFLFGHTIGNQQFVDWISVAPNQLHIASIGCGNPGDEPILLANCFRRDIVYWGIDHDEFRIGNAPDQCTIDLMRARNRINTSITIHYEHDDFANPKRYFGPSDVVLFRHPNSAYVDRVHHEGRNNWDRIIRNGICTVRDGSLILTTTYYDAEIDACRRVFENMGVTVIGQYDRHQEGARDNYLLIGQR